MPGIIPATIVSIRDETPTVRVFGLDLDGQRLVFLPGQWIDCYLTPAGGPEVAGYSMTSTPGESTRIEIAVKRVGDNAVTHHLHAGAREGDVLYIDGGYGDFAYTREMGSSIVLIAGGIGITPLMSMVRYVDESAPGTRAMLLYSGVVARGASVQGGAGRHRGTEHQGPRAVYGDAGSGRSLGWVRWQNRRGAVRELGSRPRGGVLRLRSAGHGAGGDAGVAPLGYA